MAAEKTKKTKYIFLAGRIAVVLCGITWAAVWLSKEQRWQKFAQILQGVNLWAFAATLGFFVIGMLLVTVRWLLLLRTQSIHISFWAGVRLYFLGWFYNNFMPSSLGGDLIRAWYVTTHTDKKFEAALSVFVDRIMGLASTLIIAVFFYSVFLRGQIEQLGIGPKAGSIKKILEHKTIFLQIILALAAVLCLMLIFDKSRRLLVRIWIAFVSGASKIFSKLKNAIVVYCRRPLTILAAIGLTISFQLMVITGFWLLGPSLGINISIKYYFVFFPLTWVLGAVPVSIGGAVVIESLLAFMFIRFAGVEAESALALALCQRIIWMIASLPGAIIHIVGAHLPKDFSID